MVGWAAFRISGIREISMLKTKFYHTFNWVLIVTCWFTAVVLSGCAGVDTFPGSARPGDTIILTTGLKHGFNRDNLDVIIVSEDGTLYNYTAGDPAIRAVLNLYPDPVSWLAVSGIVGSDGGIKYAEAESFTNTIETYHTGGDPDWWQTAVFLDLPVGITAGIAQVSISSPTRSYGPVPVNILDSNTAGTGEPALFNTDPLGFGGAFPLSQSHLESMGRSPHYTITFTGTSLPAAIEVEFQHNPDSLNGGIGKALVVSPGNRKSVHWHDDGQTLRVIITTAGTNQLIPGLTEPTLDRWKALKLYIAGGIEGLTLSSVQGFDEQGNPLNVAANIQ